MALCLGSVSNWIVPISTRLCASVLHIKDRQKLPVLVDIRVVCRNRKSKTKIMVVEISWHVTSRERTVQQAVQVWCGGSAPRGPQQTHCVPLHSYRSCCGLALQSPGGTFGHHSPISRMEEGMKDIHRLMMGVPRIYQFPDSATPIFEEARVLILGVHVPS